MIVTRTPFRITLGGGGTDLPSYYQKHGGYILAAGIDKYMYLMLHPPTLDKMVRLQYSKSEVVFHASELQHELAREALLYMGVETKIELSSLADLPAGTGLGSSGSYLIGLLMALSHYKREFVTLQQLAEIACHLEIDILKKPVGKQDQYMATFGGLTSLEIGRDGQVKVTPLVKGTSSLAEFVANTHMYYTGFRRDALEVLQDQNRALEEDESPQRGQVEDSLRRIHELGFEIKDAIASDNYDRWGELLHTHWTHKKNLSSKISLTRVDQIYEEVRRDYNVLGGKISGAGGGGFLMLYCTGNHKRLESFMASQNMPRLHYNIEPQGTKVVADLGPGLDQAQAILGERVTIGVSGLWHLGCVLCASWAGLGHRVLGFDQDGQLLQNLREGRPPIYEPGLEEALAHPKVSWAGSVQDLQQCEVVFIAIDTPVDDQDRSLTQCLEEQMAILGPLLPDGALVVVSSQSPVGFCRKLRGLLQDHNPSLELAYSPENLRLGEALRCYRQPGTIVVGAATEEVAERCRQLFGSIEANLLCMSLESAEMAKHGINSFLAMSIVYTNELANLCEATGADVSQVVSVMKSDPRIGARAYLEPGVGFSGGTLGRDLRVLGGQGGDFFEDLWQRNSDRKNHIVRRLGAVAGKRIGVLGLTYKPGTSTLRRSLPLAVVCDLQAAGAEVSAYDPKADFSELPEGVKVERATSPLEAARRAEVLLLLTAWPEFLQLDWAELASVMKEAVLFDCKNCLNQATVEQAGFAYMSLGR